jgi:hypothetical protein
LREERKEKEKEKKEREVAGGFFPKARGQTHLAVVPGGIVTADRYN